MSGHVQIYADDPKTTRVSGDFQIAEALWIDSAVQLILRPMDPAAAISETVRVRLNAGAVIEVLGAVIRFAADADLGTH